MPVPWLLPTGRNTPSLRNLVGAPVVVGVVLEAVSFLPPPPLNTPAMARMATTTTARATTPPMMRRRLTIVCAAGERAPPRGAGLRTVDCALRAAGAGSGGGACGGAGAGGAQ